MSLRIQAGCAIAQVAMTIFLLTLPGHILNNRFPDIAPIKPTAMMAEPYHVTKNIGSSSLQ